MITATFIEWLIFIQKKEEMIHYSIFVDSDLKELGLIRKYN